WRRTSSCKASTWSVVAACCAVWIGGSQRRAKCRCSWSTRRWSAWCSVPVTASRATTRCGSCSWTLAVDDLEQVLGRLTDLPVPVAAGAFERGQHLWAFERGQGQHGSP